VEAINMDKRKSHLLTGQAALFVTIVAMILIVPLADSVAQSEVCHCDEGCDSDCECSYCFAISPMTTAASLSTQVIAPQCFRYLHTETCRLDQVCISDIDHPPNTAN
jgi:hypothetical protein